MKALKTLVIFMGLLVIAGIGLVGYGIAVKTPHGGDKGVSSAAVNRDMAGSAGFGAVSVPLPAGATVEQIAVAGDRVVLRVTGGGGERLIVLDPKSGQVTGTFLLSPQAPLAR